MKPLIFRPFDNCGDYDKRLSEIGVKFTKRVEYSVEVPRGKGARAKKNKIYKIFGY